ncbi:MAG: hypothetical protein Q8O84_04310, partial [Nanoarchaeota archaeon]|nr:hypothetical protein [Nanoarchaeota archaeon]
KCQRFSAIMQLKEIIVTTLDKKEKLLVYEMTDGKNKREEIIKETGCSAGAISSWWIDWYSKGLLEKIEGGRYKRIISLGEIGINVPKKTNKENKPNSQEVIENAGEPEQQQNQQDAS